MTNKESLGLERWAFYVVASDESARVFLCWCRDKYFWCSFNFFIFRRDMVYKITHLGQIENN